MQPSPRVRVLGLIAAVTPDGNTQTIPGVARRRLLAMLAHRAPDLVSADSLVDVLEVSEGALRTTISRLRRSLGTELVITEARGYALRTTDTDIAWFESAVRDQPTDPVQRIDHLQSALGLWQGPAFAEFADESWALAASVRLDELRSHAIEDLAEAHLATQQWSEAIHLLDAHIANHPFRDRPRGQLMTAYAAEGRQTEALRSYEAYRRFLGEEVGTTPSAEVRKLSERLATEVSGVAIGVPTSTASTSSSTNEPRSVVVLAANIDKGQLVAAHLENSELDEIEQVISTNGGTAVEASTFAVAARFGAVSAAVRAAIDLQKLVAPLSLSSGDAPTALAVGIGIGAVLPDRTMAETVGDISSVVAAAQPGEIICSQVAVTASRGRRSIPAVVLTDRHESGPAKQNLHAIVWSPRADDIAWAQPSRQELPFVGRAAELDVIAGATARASAGEPQALLITGESGSGRTRLLWEASQRLPADTSVYVVQQTKATSLAEVLRSRLAELRPFGADILTPELEQRVMTLTGELGDVTLADKALRFKAFEAIGDLFRITPHNGLVALIIEDLHHGHDDGFDLLTALSADGRSGNLLLIGTAATVGTTSGGPIAALSTQLRRNPRGDVLQVSPLTPEDISLLLRHAHNGRAGHAGPAAVEQLHRQSAGNATYVMELVRASGSVRASGNDSEEQPTSLHDLINTQIDELPPEVHELVVTGAVLGPQFDMRLLATVVELPIDEVADKLWPALRQSILTEHAVDFDVVRFTHPIFAEIAANRVGRRQRARLHLTAAEALERQGAEVDQLALHYAGAGPLAPAGRLVETSVRAGEAALSRLAFHAATQRFRAATEIIEADLPAHGADMRYRSSFGLALALSALGEGDLAAPRFEQAAAAAMDESDAQRLAAVALEASARFNPFGGCTPDRSKEVLLEKAQAALDDNAYATRARIASQLAAVVTPHGIVQAEEWADQAMTLAERSGDPLVLGYVLSERDSIVSSPDDADDRLARARRIIAIAQSEGADDLEMRGHQWLAVVAFEMNQPDVFWAAAAERDRLAQVLADPVYRWTSMMHASLKAACSGHIDVARERSRDALEMGIRLLGADAHRFAHAQRASLGGLDRAEPENLPMLRGIVDSGAAPLTVSYMLVTALIDVGDVEEAEQRLDELPTAAHVLQNFDWYRVQGRMALANALLGRTAAAHESLELLKPYAGRFCVLGDGGLQWSISHRLGEIYALLDDRPTALSWLARAADEYTRFGASPWAAKANVQRLEVAAGKTSALADVDQLAASTRAAALSMGLDGLVERIDSLMTRDT